MSSVSLLPIRLTSKIVPGFGRGSKELGIPTANVSRDNLHCDIEFDKLPTGIYWGFARITGQSTSSCAKTTEEGSSARATPPTTGTDATDNDDKPGASSRTKSVCSPDTVYKTAVSIGFNPYFDNEKKTVEPHLIAPPEDPNRHVSSCGETEFGDMYGAGIRLSIVGYMRPELPFEGLEKLKDAIKKDIVETERLCGDETDLLVVSESSWVGGSGSDL